VAQALELRKIVDRENVLIKIPATKPGLSAIRRTIAAGVSVNVTLIFSLERYQEVIEAYLSGLEEAAAAGIELSTIHSVASVFVSRIDSEVDKRLDALGTEEASALTGGFAIANTRLAYQACEAAFTGERFEKLAAQGANRQRPLWASTGVKDPSMSDTRYVDELIAEGVVNTMPEKTLLAVADHGEGTTDTVTGHYEQARQTSEAVAKLVDLDDVFAVLEREGVEKFEKSWIELINSTEQALAELRG